MDELVTLLADWRRDVLGDAGAHDRDGCLPDEVVTAAKAIGLGDIAADADAAVVAARELAPAGLGHVIALVIAPRAAALVGVAAGTGLVLKDVALGCAPGAKALHLNGSLTEPAGRQPPGWLGLRVATPLLAASGMPRPDDSRVADEVDRLLLAALAGVTRHLADLARDYAGQREAFGRPIRRFQTVAHRLVDIEADALAVAALADVGDMTTNRARLLASLQHAWSLVEDVLQVHGGIGYAEELEVARHWRDIRMLRGLVEAAPVTQFVTDAAARRPLRTEAREVAAARTQARAVVAEHLTPNVTEWELSGEWPRDVIRTLGDSGFLARRFPRELGGQDAGVVAQAMWIEELARCGAGGLAADIGASIDLAAVYLERAGSADQHDRWLRPLLRGETIGALAITEPGTGSDVAGITTRARRTDDAWVIDGAKVFITNGPWADVLVVAAKVSPDDGGGETPHGQITLFAVDGDAAGVTRRRLSMLGWRTSHTGELHFDAVAIPDDQRLGDIGSGFGWIMQNFAWERVTLALGATVACEAALDGIAVAHRDSTWRHLDNQVQAARVLTDDALTRTESASSDPETLKRVAIAKLRTQGLAVRCADLAMTSAGTAALRLDHPAQRWLRDARLGPIGGGTDAIMREIVAKLLP